MEAKEALFDFIYNGDFDTDEYESKEDAIDDLVQDVSYSHYGMEQYECDGGEYAITDSYSEVEEAAHESVKSLLDDIGIEGFNLGSLNNYVDSDWFYETEKEMHESYADDISNESSSDSDRYVNRQHEELCDYGIMEELDLPEEPEQEDFQTDEGEDDEDAYNEAYDEWATECDNLRSDVESEAQDKSYELAEKMMSDDSVQYYIDNFGESEFNELVKNNNLADFDAIAEYVVDIDGPGHILSSYDGEMYEEGDFYIFRTN